MTLRNDVKKDVTSHTGLWVPAPYRPSTLPSHESIGRTSVRRKAGLTRQRICHQTGFRMPAPSMVQWWQRTKLASARRNQRNGSEKGHHRVWWVLVLSHSEVPVLECTRVMGGMGKCSVWHPFQVLLIVCTNCSLLTGRQM